MVRIPSEYQEVEYIESTGTQWIDLPFGFDPTDEIETKFSIATSQSNDKYIVSPNRWNDNANRFALGVHMGGLYTAGFGDNNTGTTILLPNTSNDGKIHEWIYNNYVFSISDVLASKDVSNITFKATTTNLRLFYGYNANTKGKIASYNHKKANGTEINLIPCYRKSDNEIGMYDTVTGTFFTNQGRGTFLKGNDVTYDTVNLMESRRRILLNTPHLESLSGSTLSFKTDIASKLKECKIHFTPVQEGSGDPSPDNVRPISGWDGVTIFHNTQVPPEYQEVEYLHGRECIIDLNYVPTVEPVLKAKIQISDGNDRDIAGFKNNTYPSFIVDAYSFARKWYNRCGATSYTVVDKLEINVIQEWEFGKETKFNGSVVHTFADADWSGNTQSMHIFGARNRSLGVAFYNCSLYDGENLVRNLVPCYRKSDNVAGMYDTVSKQFYTNSGTGEFTVGPDVTGGTAITIPFPQTIYGGYVDLVKGEVVEEWDSEGQQITPNTYSIIPQTICTLKGLNNIFSDANGNIEIKYWTH